MDETPFLFYYREYKILYIENHKKVVVVGRGGSSLST